MWYHIYTNRCENTMTCMNDIIITHRVRLITDDSRLTVETVWESHSGRSTTGKGEYWDTRHSTHLFRATSRLQLETRHYTSTQFSHVQKGKYISTSFSFYFNDDSSLRFHTLVFISAFWNYHLHLLYTPLSDWYQLYFIS